MVVFSICVVVTFIQFWVCIKIWKTFILSNFFLRHCSNYEFWEIFCFIYFDEKL